MATVQFKRGTSSRWNELNPILESGEPGYDMTSGRMKIGDGVTHWRELLYQDEKAVISRKTKLDFPQYGKEHTLYKDETAQQLYQWVVDEANPNGGYKVIGTEGTLDINIINGGNAECLN